MTRDMELIRKILTEIQGRTDLKPRPVQIDGYEDQIVTRHVQLLLKAGLLEATERPSGSSHIPFITVTDLTWDGHEFAAAASGVG